MVQKYSASGGPVVISSSNGANIIASLLQLRRQANTGPYTGIAQLMGVQEEKLSDKYVLPYYDGTDVTKYNSLQFANYENFDTFVTVKIGSITYPAIELPSGTSYNFTVPIKGGPVVIQSNNGARIIASLAELKRAASTSGWNGQSNMMALPWAELSDTYVIPRYINTSQLDVVLHIANVDDISRSISVVIGDVAVETFNLESLTSVVKKYSASGGPVVISSSNGANIIASLLQLRRQANTGPYTGIAQLMGVQEEKLSDKYVLPYYDGTDVTKYNSLQFANYENFDTFVTVKIGSITYPAIELPSGTSYNFTVPIKGGPVVIQSNNGARIIASLAELKRTASTSGWNGQSNMMALPWAELSDTYVIPRYINTSQLDVVLHIAVP
jgi:hypothetical protein